MTISNLTLGNRALQLKDYASALWHYREALKTQPYLKEVLYANIKFVERWMVASQANDKPACVGAALSMDSESILIEKIKSYDLKELMECINNSGYFNAEWYLAENVDVAKNPKINPLSHFARNGGREYRNPGPQFDTRWYVGKYPEVDQYKINPVVHFQVIGKNKGYLTRRESVKEESAEKFIDNSIYHTVKRISKNQLPVVIIIPVFNAFEELRDCIRSVLGHTRHSFRLVMINDASTDPRIGSLLNDLIGTKSIEVYHNEKNLGFTATINRGIKLAGLSDVIFLNSDTRVSPNWLTNLRVAAYLEDRTGTATPFSNNAGAYSAPLTGKANSIPDGYHFDEWARAINQNVPRIYPKAPTGHGFCMYVRRDCLEDVGYLDAVAFPRGYGEENDFCMRAARNGWSHVVDQSTLIYHVQSASFGESKTELLKHGRKVINERYPEYTGKVREFIKQPDLNESLNCVKNTLSMLLEKKRKIKPRILYTLSTKTGGTPQTNQDLMRALGGDLETYVLYSNAKKIDLFLYENEEYALKDSYVFDDHIKVLPHRDECYDAKIAEWLIRYSFEIIHIRHLAWHSLGLVDVAKLLGIPIVMSFHDFYTVCPTVKLLDADNNYCGGRCTAGLIDCTYDLWSNNNLPRLKNGAIKDWRVMFESIFQKCDVFITTSESAKGVLLDNYPALLNKPFYIIAHGRDFSEFNSAEIVFAPSEPLKLLVPGNITNAKGGAIISGLAEKSKSLNIEVHVLGKVAKNVNSTNFYLHGEYSRDDFVDKAREIGAHVGCIFSIWPETYCHTLTELWAAGLPVIGFSIGAVGERLKQTEAGWSIDIFTIDEVEVVLKEIRSNPFKYIKARNKTISWQQNCAVAESCSSMALQYKVVYEQFISLN